MFPPSAVASVSGIGGFAGAMGGVLFQWLTGRILDATGGNYASIFAVCGFAYVTAWTIISLASAEARTGGVTMIAAALLLSLLQSPNTLTPAEHQAGWRCCLTEKR